MEIEEAACPHGHQTLYRGITSIRDQVHTLELSDLEIEIIRQTLLFNSDPAKEVKCVLAIEEIFSHLMCVDS